RASTRGGAGRAASKNTLRSSQLPGEQEGILVGNGVEFINYREIHISGQLGLADSLGLVWLHLRLAARFEHFREDRTNWIGTDNADLRIFFLKESRNA